MAEIQEGFVVAKRRALTVRRLEVIKEALHARLAGEFNAEFGSDAPDNQKDYEMALDWAEQQLLKKLLKKRMARVARLRSKKP